MSLAANVVAQEASLLYVLGDCAPPDHPDIIPFPAQPAGIASSAD